MFVGCIALSHCLSYKVGKELGFGPGMQMSQYQVIIVNKREKAYEGRHVVIIHTL